ncbi:MAG: hypothetical protein ACE10K_13970, partial [Rhodothermales bacterium]
MPIFRHFGIAPGHPSLDGDRAFECIDDAGKFHQNAVAHELYDTTPAGDDLGLDQLLPMRLETRQRARLILAHKTAIADDVG